MLIKCPEWGEEISDKSEKCIHCGYPIGKQPNLETNKMIYKGKDNPVYKRIPYSLYLCN